MDQLMENNRVTPVNFMAMLFIAMMIQERKLYLITSDTNGKRKSFLLANFVCTVIYREGMMAIPFSKLENGDIFYRGISCCKSLRFYKPDWL